MEKKVNKNGDYYRKQKLAKLEADHAKLQAEYKTEVSEHQALEESYVRLKNDLNKTISQQQSTISKLTAELDGERKAHERDIKRMAAMADDLMSHMGWLRRWLWVTFRSDKFVD